MMPEMKSATEAAETVLELFQTKKPDSANEEDSASEEEAAADPSPMPVKELFPESSANDEKAADDSPVPVPGEDSESETWFLFCIECAVEILLTELIKQHFLLSKPYRAT